MLIVEWFAKKPNINYVINKTTVDESAVDSDPKTMIGFRFNTVEIKLFS